MMLELGLTSLWHWNQRPDRTPTSLSIGTWQVARICTLLGLVESARRYGQLSLEAARSEGVLPFYLGYAYEGLARAEAKAGNREKVQEYLDLALQAAGKVTEAEAKKQLLADLETIA